MIKLLPMFAQLQMTLRLLLGRPVARYGIAIVSVCIGVLIESWYSDFFEPIAFSMFMYLVFFLAHFFGFGPALASIALIQWSVLWIFGTGRGVHLPDDEFVLRMLSFGTSATLISWFIRRYQVVTADLRKSEERLSLLAERESAARKVAEDANQAKSTFLANMSHEIRTPIGAILGFTELLRNPDTSTDDRESFIDTISRNGTALNHLINDILDLSKVEAGHMQMEWMHFSLKPAVQEVVSLLSPRATRKGLEVHFRIADAVPRMITSDPIRLKQILTNLLGNAIKFTDSGGIDIHVRCSGDQIIFQIHDTGIGLSVEQISQLFQPFHQADNSISRLYGGTGLGLALSRNLARLLGGDVRLVSSSQGQGTVFEVSIVNQLVQAAGEMDVTLWNEACDAISLSGLRVLLVDDSPDNQMLITRILHKAGASVETAVNGENGVAAALEKRPDVVLMDISMPVMDGLTATHMLRKQGYKAPIIALSAHAMKDVREQCMRAGSTDYVAKPINRYELLSKLKGLLPKRNMHHQSDTVQRFI